MEPEQQLKVRHYIAWSSVTLGLIVLIMIVMWFSREINQVTAASVTQDAADSTIFAAGERQQIDTWIDANGLNQYGDPADTEYNLEPTVDELTGEYQDRYEVIVKKHPKRPWRQTTAKN